MQSGLLTESGKTKSFTKQSHENQLTKRIEKQAAKIPSAFFLAAAGASVALAVGLAVSKKPKWASFVGEWVPTILLLGLYNKILKSQEAAAEDAYLH